MKKLVFTMLCMAALMVFDACSKDEMVTNNPSVEVLFKDNPTVTIDSQVIRNYLEGRSENLRRTRSKSESRSEPIFNETFTQQADGYSTIKTNKSGVTFNYKAYNIPHLDPSGHAVTLWAVFFDIGDPLDEAHIASMYRVNGHVIDKDGVVEFGGRVNEGQAKDLWYGVPLKDAENFVLLVIAKTHGLAIPGIINEQLHDLEGGCNGDGPDPDLPCYEFLWSLHL